MNTENDYTIIQLQQDILEMVESGEIAVIYDAGEFYYYCVNQCSSGVMDVCLTVQQYKNLMEPLASGRNPLLN